VGVVRAVPQCSRSRLHRFWGQGAPVVRASDAPIDPAVRSGRAAPPRTLLNQALLGGNVVGMADHPAARPGAQGLVAGGCLRAPIAE